MSAGVRAERARCAALARFRNTDDPALIAARQRLRFELCVQAVERAMAAAHPLTPADREQIIAIVSDRAAA